jgi:hypothetical protein
MGQPRITGIELLPAIQPKLRAHPVVTQLVLLILEGQAYKRARRRYCRLQLGASLRGSVGGISYSCSLRPALTCTGRFALPGPSPSTCASRPAIKCDTTFYWGGTAQGQQVRQQMKVGLHPQQQTVDGHKPPIRRLPQM